MDLPPRLETILRRDEEDATQFSGRIERHVQERAADGWQLQTRQDHDTSVNLVFVHPPVH